MLLKIADVLRLTDEECAEMFELADRERNETAPELPEYIMDEIFSHVRAALRKASDKNLGDDFYSVFWRKLKRKDKNDQRSISQLPCPSNI